MKTLASLLSGCFPDVDSHRSQQLLFEACVHEPRSAHHLLHSALTGISLERLGDIEISLRISVKEPADRWHHRVEKPLVERARDRILRLAEVEDHGPSTGRQHAA